MREEYDGIGIFENVEEGSGGYSLEAVVRNAAQRMIEGALEAEVTEFLGRLPGEKSERAEGFRGYRNGYHGSRKITTAVGALTVRQPRVSDVPDEAGKYRSQLIKPYRRRSDALDILFPRLFIEGLATRDFEPALRALVGEDASPSSVSRLNKQFKDEYGKWKSRQLNDLEIIYVWADGVYLKAGISDEKLCALVVMGADRTGKKHLLAISEGYRESKESWLEVLRDLKARGMNEPAIAIADGGLGFWAATVPAEVWHQTKEQLCWLHKTRNILDKVPKKEHKDAAERLRAVYLADGKDAAARLAERLMNDWKQTGYLKAAECLERALERLLTFHSFPTEHARHLRTTNPIESPFASVKLRTNAARRFRSAHSALHLLFKLLERSEKGWQRLSFPEKLKEVKLPNNHL